MAASDDNKVTVSDEDNVTAPESDEARFDGYSSVIEHGGGQDDAGRADEADDAVDDQEDPVEHQRYVLPVLLHLNTSSTGSSNKRL